LEKKVAVSDLSLDINEIFYSIQGESSFGGLPCIFVRLSFCNLRCGWCDSTYTFFRGASMSLAEVLERVRDYPCRLVEITGGEPLLQESVFPLMTALCDEGYELLLETSGSQDIRLVDPRVRRIMDLKCPGSGMQDRNRYQNVGALTSRDEVKFVISDRNDYEWAKRKVSEFALANLCTVLFSPVFGIMENVQLAEWILDDGLPVRFQVQLHKHIWDPSTRGV
jgi:7-carboxy-7-deazaguanine synthase